MTTKNKPKPFTTVEMSSIKKMYEDGLPYKEIAQVLNRSVESVMAATNRLLTSGQIKYLRCPAIQHLGGIEAAQTALSKAKNKGNKTVHYISQNGKGSHVLIPHLEKQIARYTAANY